MIKSKRAIDYFTREMNINLKKHVFNREIEEEQFFFGLAVEALTEKLKREQGCNWCKEFKGIELSGFTMHGTKRTTVYFCPNCGKKLID